MDEYQPSWAPRGNKKPKKEKKEAVTEDMQEAAKEEIEEQEKRITGEERRWPWYLGFVIGIAILILIIFYKPTTEAERFADTRVAATIFPVYDIARNIGKGAVEVSLILPAGASPHTFDPTPSLVASLRGKEVIYKIGFGIDDWVDELLSEETDKVTVEDGIALSKFDPDRDSAEITEAGHGQEFEAFDPHYWLSVKNGSLMAETIALDMMERFPEHASTIRDNLTRYLKALDIADRSIKTELQDISNRKMVTLHDAWFYFAEAYGFEIIGTFEPAPGREPSPKYLAELTEVVKQLRTKVLYSETQLPTSSIRPFANDNQLKIVELDILGGTSGRETYIDMMKYNAKLIKDNQNE